MRISPLKYLMRLGIYFFIFLLTTSVFTVFFTRYIPVIVTPYKVYRMVGNLQDYGLGVKVEWSRVKNISPVVVSAVISTEDAKFVDHNGFDFDAISKAREERKKGKRFRGASTISQQTAKNVFCTPHRNWFRKGIEAYFTVLIETFWSKKRIMEVYLNVVEIRPGMYGVGSAAKFVYNKKTSELNVYEAAMIATVLPNPYVMNIMNPSSYMNRRASDVRLLINKTGSVDFDKKK